MRSQLEDTIERQSTSLEEHITPVPAIVLYDMMGLSLDPEVERDEGETTNPPKSCVSTNKSTIKDVLRDVQSSNWAGHWEMVAWFRAALNASAHRQSAFRIFLSASKIHTSSCEICGLGFDPQGKLH